MLPALALHNVNILARPAGQLDSRFNQLSLTISGITLEVVIKSSSLNIFLRLCTSKVEQN